MPFVTELEADFIRGTRELTLTAPLTYKTEKGELITAPAGFKTDLASIPRILWSWLSPDDPQIRDAAVIHDYLYTVRDKGTRKEADELLVEMMKSLSASWFTRELVWTAVRVGGSAYWVDSEQPVAEQQPPEYR